MDGALRAARPTRRAVARGNKAIGTGLAVLLVLLASGCGSDGDSGQDTGTTVPTAAPSRAVPIGPRLEKILVAAGAGPETPVVVRSCAATRLDGDADLMHALGTEPADSPRLQDARRLVEECRVTAQQGAAAVEALQAKAGGRLSSAQLGCVRDGLSHYGAPDRERALAPGLLSLEPGPLRDRVNELLSICAVDRAIFETQESVAR